MNLKRIAAYVAAATMAPALFLATPAVAADTAPTGATSLAAAEPVLAFKDFPTSFTPGGDWSNFSITMENRTGQTLTDFHASLLFQEGYSTKEDIKQGDVELEYYAGGRWHPVDLWFGTHRFSGEVCPQADPVGGPNSWYLNCPAKIGDLKPGDTYALDLRVRFASSAPAAKYMLTASGYIPVGSTDKYPLPVLTDRYRFTVQPAQAAAKP
ncbi:hypothetical protein LE181_02990 [Streptomyces sp. SCA3-4]|uniref:hypothetical protein n=1 Tax=Streptomyces sichuanensis TaxID=2871810 RepID=UPI001CE35ADF|nr:hypothetical protein [Streptomyces sichuanensis]MCA6091136.1 hypothetical protein [Streptomyces sichuanensis]